jgi:hypothetical protein
VSCHGCAPGHGAVPALKEIIQLFQAVKFPPFEGVILEVATTALDNTLLLGMARSTGERHKTPVFGKGSIKLADIGVIETGTSYSSLRLSRRTV